MTQNIDLRQHFGAPVLHVQLPAFARHREALLAYVEELRGSSEGVRRSNQDGSWHSREDLQRDDNPAIEWLCRRIVHLAGIGIASTCDRERPVQTRLCSLWANVNAAGSWNAPHHHLPADWSGVFWVDAEEDTPPDPDQIPPGSLLFLDPLPLLKKFGRPGTVYYIPENGTLVLFPAYLNHMVTPHRRSKPRVSLSFNLQLVEDEETT